jgi:hypothetical protein
MQLTSPTDQKVNVTSERSEIEMSRTFRARVPPLFYKSGATLDQHGQLSELKNQWGAGLFATLYKNGNKHVHMN